MISKTIIACIKVLNSETVVSEKGLDSDSVSAGIDALTIDPTMKNALNRTSRRDRLKNHNKIG